MRDVKIEVYGILGERIDAEGQRLLHYFLDALAVRKYLVDANGEHLRRIGHVYEEFADLQKVVLLVIALLEDRIGWVLLVDHLVVHVHHALLKAEQIETGCARPVQADGVFLVDGDVRDGIGIAVFLQAQRDLQRQRHKRHPVHERCVVVGGQSHRRAPRLAKHRG